MKRKAELVKENKKSDQSYRDLLESKLGGMFIFDAETMRILLSNQAAAEMFGIDSPKEAIGRNIFDFIRPEGREQARRIVFGKTMMPLEELQTITIDGKEKWVDAAGATIKYEGKSAGLVLLVDVSGRKEKEEPLNRKLAERENLLQSANDLIYAVDINGRFTYINSRIEDYGYAPEELIGKPFLSILSEKHRGIRFNKTIREKIRQIYEVELKTKDGAIKNCHLSTSPLVDQKGSVVGLVATLRDITEREQLMEEVSKKSSEIENFVYSVSHDLRASVISIQGFSAILLADFHSQLGEAGERYLTRIQANARQMENLIDDLLDFSMIGRVAGAFEDVPAAEIISDSLYVLEPQLKNKGVKVNVQEALPVIYCERRRIYQVFMNLIGNGIKFTGDTENPLIEVGCRSTDGFHEFYVRDNGIGIEPEYHQKIFEAFQRLGKIDVKGAGIGLAIVKKIAEAHGGSVHVESEKGKGATFYFSIPEKNLIFGSYPSKHSNLQ